MHVSPLWGFAFLLFGDPRARARGYQLPCPCQGTCIAIPQVWDIADNLVLVCLGDLVYDDLGQEVHVPRLDALLGYEVEDQKRGERTGFTLELFIVGRLRRLLSQSASGYQNADGD